LLAVFKLEAIKGPAGPRELYDFRKPDTVQDCVVMSDKQIGGSSQSNFEYISSSSDPSTSTSSSTSPTHSSSISKPFTTPASTTSQPTSYGRFYGTVSTTLPENRPKIKRTGYAAFRTPDQKPNVFGRGLWDIDPYAFLALRLKSDGRSYFVNVQTQSIEPTDLHQHRLFAKRPGQWETVLIRWNDFVRTNHGFVMEPQTEMLRQKVLTVGIGLTDRVEGPFELCIERVWATNDATEGDVVETPQESELKTKSGEKVHW
jgi:NADH dehydrogenase [ubiquinone] 1 alpha subcomplex assembly factor 1